LVYTTLNPLQNGRPSVEVVIVPDAAAGGELIAEAMAALLRRKPDALLGVATGSTPLPVYQALAAKVRSGAVDASQARVCQLDEYVGLPAGHPESYRSVVLREVVEPLGLSESSFMGPDGSAEDVLAACEAYDAALASAGGVDLQLLGIGTDGHIGFNEPCSSLASRTRIKTLTEQTRVDNARFFGGDIGQVPHHVITQGIGTILEARHVVLLATGEGKAEAVAQTVEGPVAAVVPASALQLHAHATVVVDEAAASELKLAGYFRATFAAKPGWQHL
jgi:glucosamine-6-phosphate deaminase